MNKLFNEPKSLHVIIYDMFVNGGVNMESQLQIKRYFSTTQEKLAWRFSKICNCGDDVQYAYIRRHSVIYWTHDDVVKLSPENQVAYLTKYQGEIERLNLEHDHYWTYEQVMQLSPDAMNHYARYFNIGDWTYAQVVTLREYEQANFVAKYKPDWTIDQIIGLPEGAQMEFVKNYAERLRRGQINIMPFDEICRLSGVAQLELIKQEAAGVSGRYLTNEQISRLNPLTYSELEKLYGRTFDRRGMHDRPSLQRGFVMRNRINAATNRADEFNRRNTQTVTPVSNLGIE